MYRDLSGVLSSLTVEEGFEPTGCAGWTPVDLAFYLLGDARRAPVALHTPAAGAAVHQPDLVLRPDRAGPAAARWPRRAGYWRACSAVPCRWTRTT